MQPSDDKCWGLWSCDSVCDQVHRNIARWTIFVFFIKYSLMPDTWVSIFLIIRYKSSSQGWVFVLFLVHLFSFFSFHNTFQDIFYNIYFVSMKIFLRDGSPRGRIAGRHCNANPTARDWDRAKHSPKTFSCTENISRLYIFSQGQRKQKQTCVQKLEHFMMFICYCK